MINLHLEELVFHSISFLFWLMLLVCIRPIHSKIPISYIVLSLQILPCIVLLHVLELDYHKILILSVCPIWSYRSTHPNNSTHHLLDKGRLRKRLSNCMNSLMDKMKEFKITFATLNFFRTTFVPALRYALPTFPITLLIKRDAPAPKFFRITFPSPFFTRSFTSLCLTN